MSDVFVTDTAGVFEVGQTVLAKVTNLDEEKCRFLISLKVSDVTLAESNVQARMIQGQRERMAVYDAMASGGKRNLKKRQNKYIAAKGKTLDGQKKKAYSYVRVE